MYRAKVLDQFVEDVSEHQLTIMRDAGVYRHLLCRNPKFDKMYAFEIITAPNLLLFHGDCGTFVFSRLHDMFQFFRSDCVRSDLPLGYWSEKIEAAPAGIDVMMYSQRLAEDSVQAVFDTWAQSQSLQGSELEHAQQELDDQILIHCDSLDALFDCIGTELECGYTFDIVDVNYRTLHPAAIWCMYAIVWAIRQYDKAKESKEQK